LWILDGIDQGVKLSSSRVFAAALVGGTTSVMTGGKFGNGAMTGAFSRAFNDEMHPNMREDCGSGSKCELKNPGMRKRLSKLAGQMESDGAGVLDISGGDSHWSDELGAVVSDSTGDIIDNRSLDSTHNKGEDHVGIDIRSSSLNLKQSEYKSYFYDRGFKVLVNGGLTNSNGLYKDGHIHLTCQYCPPL
jgi:hypothetical protein